jgi:soluble lytic murein transglycosylase
MTRCSALPPALLAPAMAFTLLLSMLLLPIRPAAAQDVLSAVRAQQWDQADAAAAQWLDPVALKLVAYYRMLTQGAASAVEIDSFMAQNPDWPNQALLARRREGALALEPDDGVVVDLCARLTLHTAPALLRCATADANTGQTEPANAAARQAWVSGGITDAGAETRFLQRWDSVVTQADQWQRFQALAWTNTAAATRQAARLDPAHRREADVLLALRRGDPQAESILKALPDALRASPETMLLDARRLRTADQDPAALTLWQSFGATAQASAPASRLPAFWSERSQLARRLLADGDAAGAYWLADNPGRIDGTDRLDADFLAGWIALRKLNKPADAARHFTAIAVSKAAISRARAQYWLGRAAAAQGDAAGAKADYAAAARFPTTYYGQLAAQALGDGPPALNARITALHDPSWTSQDAIAFASREVARAAELLVAWGDPSRARPFLARLQGLAPDPADEAMASQFALGVGLPDLAVAIARRAGVDGVLLPDTGWPTTVQPPAGPVEPAVTLGLIRQESSFDVSAVSPAGAQGLMQLMPGTATEVARQLGEQVSPVSLTVDPQENMVLGTTYFRQLLDQFGGALPLAIAAYNAGPTRVQQWLGEIGDPRTGAIDWVDWIEMIPFDETRNYVQRVLENITVYRAQRGVTTALPVLATRG